MRALNSLVLLQPFLDTTEGFLAFSFTEESRIARARSFRARGLRVEKRRHRRLATRPWPFSAKVKIPVPRRGNRKNQQITKSSIADSLAIGGTITPEDRRGVEPLKARCQSTCSVLSLVLPSGSAIPRGA